MPIMHMECMKRGRGCKVVLVTNVFTFSRRYLNTAAAATICLSDVLLTIRCYVHYACMHRGEGRRDHH